MPRFDQKTWNNTIFQKYLNKIPNLKANSMIKNGVLVVNNNLKSRLVDGVGGNTLIEPIKGLADGDYVNYDGNTDITTSSRNTFTQKKIVVGRAKGWQEKDFSTDITGEDYMPVADEIAQYWENVDEETLLAILKGIFAMSDTAGATFIKKHTYEITSKIDATTINNAASKGFGDKKSSVSLAFMHSDVATTLENLQILEYLKYTDSNGIQSNMAIAQQGNKIVIIDDDMPTEYVSEVYTLTSDTSLDAAKTYYTRSGSAGNYTYTVVTSPVVGSIGTYYEITAEAYTKYTTYLLGKAAIEYCDIGAKVPSEVVRDAITDGGIDKLITRQRKLFAPKYISWKGADSIISPLKSDLENGANWEIVNDSAESKTYVNDKLLPFARIITRG